MTLNVALFPVKTLLQSSASRKTQKKKKKKVSPASVVNDPKKNAGVARLLQVQRSLLDRPQRRSRARRDRRRRRKLQTPLLKSKKHRPPMTQRASPSRLSPLSEAFAGGDAVNTSESNWYQSGMMILLLLLNSVTLPKTHTLAPPLVNLTVLQVASVEPVWPHKRVFCARVFNPLEH